MVCYRSLKATSLTPLSNDMAAPHSRDYTTVEDSLARAYIISGMLLKSGEPFLELRPGNAPLFAVSGLWPLLLGFLLRGFKLSYHNI